MFLEFSINTSITLFHQSYTTFLSNFLLVCWQTIDEGSTICILLRKFPKKSVSGYAPSFGLADYLVYFDT